MKPVLSTVQHPLRAARTGTRRRAPVWLALMLSCLCLQACSPKAEGAAIGTGGPSDAVVIVREKQHDHPAKFAAAMRELQDKCLSAKAVVAAAQGWSFDAAAERLTDAEIAALDTERTEEYFEGKKYAKVVTGGAPDWSATGAARDESCKPRVKPFKSVEIHDGACNVLRVEYDLDQGTGRRESLKDACDGPASPAEQAGEPMQVAGSGVQCKWTPAGPLVTAYGNVPRVPECSLLPSSIHAGTGRLMVAIRKLPDFLSQSTTPLPGTEAMDMQSLSSTEQAVSVTVGVAIAADRFKAPADSAAFPQVD